MALIVKISSSSSGWVGVYICGCVCVGGSNVVSGCGDEGGQDENNDFMRAEC